MRRERCLTILGPAILAAFLLATPAPASESRPLRALVLENATTEGWRGAEGLHPALEAAGFQVGVLKPTDSPAKAAGDLIVLGSFASELPEYGAFMKAHGAGFADFLARGGVVLQMAQSHTTEATPAFLPAGLTIERAKDASDDVRAVGRHPLTHGIARHAKDPARLHVAKHDVGGPAAAGSFAKQEGFRVLAVDRKQPERLVLLEAAVGRGRLLLTTLHLDKLNDPAGSTPDSSDPDSSDPDSADSDGDDPFGGDAVAGDATDVAGDENRKASERFFDGLAGYVRAVRSSRAPDVVPTAGAVADDPPWQPPLGPKLGPNPEQPTPIAWKLGLSDMAEYVRRPLTGTPDAEKLGKPRVLTLHGHAIREGGQYQPVSPRRGELATLLAFRLPAAGTADGEAKGAFDLHAVSPLKWSGQVTTHAIEDPATNAAAVFVRGDYEFGGRTKVRDSDKHRIENGTATVRGVFDPERGVLTRVRIDLEYDLRDVTAKRNVKPKPVRQRFVWRLEDVRRARYPTFQHDVDAAIDSGVRHLLAKRQDDGRWKAHGKYDVGTTSLMVLTLSACGIPREHAAIAEPLEWLFTTHPKKNYDRSVALMAIDEAYTPEGEAEALRRGQPVTFRRDLTDKQRAWCERAARELQRDCVGPGGFSYPVGSQYVQRADMSNTQYAILGLHAATKLGVEVPGGVWLGVLRTFDQVRDRKMPRGAIDIVREGEVAKRADETTDPAVAVRNVAGFRYNTAHKKSWSSMTCAGIASLSLARHQLKRLKSPKLNARVDKEIDAAMLGAWAWLDEHWAVDRHPEKSANDWVGYYLYSLERAALLDRVKRVGGKDWYFEGACQLLAQRCRDGGWKDNSTPSTASALTDTCFALLFLKRATAPITGR